MRSYARPKDREVPASPEGMLLVAAPSGLTGAAQDIGHRRIELQRCRKLGPWSCERCSYAPGISPSGSERLIHIRASWSMSARCSGSSMLSARDKQSNALVFSSPPALELRQPDRQARQIADGVRQVRGRTVSGRGSWGHHRRPGGFLGNEGATPPPISS
jgi:hypothetical protein